MDGASSGAFWSYAHEDNRLDGEGILGLAQHLAGEYSLITGQELNIFVDRTGISWGDAWRSRIDGALSVTTFFIPIITPRYFKRPECRKEIVSFHGGAQSLGAAELLLPILYAPIPEFGDSNPDELISLTSRYQYVDWTDHRLSGPKSPEYRRAVHELAQRLANLSAMVATRHLAKEIEESKNQEPDDEVGLFDLLDQINSLLPAWLDKVEFGEVNDAQFVAIFDLLAPRVMRLEATRGQGGARLALLQRLAKEGLPLAERHLEAATVYTRSSLDLDPVIKKLIRIVSENPESIEAVRDLRSTLKLAERGIKIDAERKRKSQAFEWVARRAHLSRLLRQLHNVSLNIATTIETGNGLVQGWISALDDLLDGSTVAQGLVAHHTKPTASEPGAREDNAFRQPEGVKPMPRPRS